MSNEAAHTLRQGSNADFLNLKQQLKPILVTMVGMRPTLLTSRCWINWGVSAYCVRALVFRFQRPIKGRPQRGTFSTLFFEKKNLLGIRTRFIPFLTQTAVGQKAVE